MINCKADMPKLTQEMRQALNSFLYCLPAYRKAPQGVSKARYKAQHAWIAQRMRDMEL